MKTINKVLAIFNSILIILFVYCICSNKIKQFNFEMLLSFYTNLKYLFWFSILSFAICLCLKLKNKAFSWYALLSACVLGSIVLIFYNDFNPW